MELSKFEFHGDGDKNVKNWKKIEQIGIGGFSNVYRAKAFTTDAEWEMAVKEINLTKDINKKNFKSFETEINVLKQLSHDRIVTYYGGYQQDFSCFIFIEYIPLRSLRHFLAMKEVLPEDLVHQFTKQLLEGIQYLHSKRIVHRDIKSLNILMSSEKNVKLTDFGIAKIFGEYSRTFTKNVGTVRYMAPELLSSVEHSYSVDIWALGCVVLEMFTGDSPFLKLDEGQIHSTVLIEKESPLESVEHKLPSRAEQFLKNIFNLKPEHRPSATDLLHDPYITGNLENISTRKLTQVFRHCNKNEDHGEFIPIKEFTLQHVPENYREKKLSELITTIADLTVKLFIKMVSPYRPEYYPNTLREYPCYGKAGSRISRVSSGEIFALSHYINGQMIERNICLYSQKIDVSDTSHDTCSCAKCLDSETPSQEWYEIFVSTTTFTVFDETEASHTSCKLFYDDDDECRKSIYFFKAILHKADVETDFCAIKYVTCDIKLGEKLQKICKRKNVLLSEILKQYENSSDRLCFIVSHPHGCPKYVSIGQWVENNKVSEYNEHLEYTRLKYTTAACPGSAGASVYCVGYKHTHVHSGRDDKLNESNIGYYYNNNKSFTK